MTTYSLCPQPNFRSLTLAGAPNASGYLYTYASGTVTPQSTWTSSTGGALNTNPVRFDANGMADVWLDSSLTYTLLEKDSAGTTIRTKDVISNAAGATGAAGTFACAAAGGTVDAITASYSPVLTLADKTMCAIVSAGANTATNPTFSPDGLTAHTITKRGGSALIAGDIGSALSVHILEYNLANTRWELINPVGNMPLAGGTTGQVLTAATGTVPTWATPSGSTLVLLGTATASASSTLSFTSLISSSYSSYRLVFVDLLNSTNASIGLKLSTDNGSAWTVSLGSTQHWYLCGTNGTETPGQQTVNASTPAQLSEAARVGPNNGWFDFVVGTTTSSSFIGKGNMTEQQSGNYRIIETFVASPAIGVNAVQLLPSAGNFTSGKIYLYGVKNT